jgi:glucokinase-like ROK family protein
MSIGTERLLELLRDQGPQPTANLGDLVNTSRSKAMQDLAELEDLGLVTRGGKAPSRGGRRSTIVSLADSLHYVGVDVGATSISAAVTDGYLNVLDYIEEESDVRVGPEAILDEVETLVRRLTDTGGGPLKASGVGLGLPSPVSFSTGRPVAPPLMPGWDGYPARDELAARLGTPVTVDNDVNIMALGEKHSGIARSQADFLFVKLGTGIGCGIVVEGEIYRGRDGCAGDIGHIAAGDPTVSCHCGRSGCLEAQVGGHALARAAILGAQSGESPLLETRLNEQGKLTAIDISRANEFGDPFANRTIRRSGQVLGEALAGIVNFFNPALIVLGGGVSGFGQLLLAELRSVVLDRSTPLATSGLQLELSTAREQAGVIGAAWLASDTFVRQATAAPSIPLPLRAS